MTTAGLGQHFGDRGNLPVKLIPPEPGPQFERRELVRKLAGLIESPGKVWVSSPGGAGKTSLVRNILARDSRPLLWYQVDGEDRDPANLFFYLTQAASGGDDKAAPLPILTPEYLPNLTAFSRIFCRALFARFEKGCVLVFDDLQERPGEQLFGPFLTAAMAELPPDSALLVVSRGEPYSRFARDRVNRSLGYLGWEDLRLSSDETRLFLAWSREEEPPQQTLDRAYGQTQGWLGGLLLFPENSAQEDRHVPASFDRTDLLFDYFAEEIFARLPAEKQGFLLRCSFLPTVGIAMAASLTGRSGAGDILRDLTRANYFTYRISTRPEIYRFHPLFRQFLRTTAEKVLDDRQLDAQREHAARLLVEDGQFEPAAELMISAGSWSLLIELISSQAETLLRQGRSQTLFHWLEALPASRRDETPWLCYWRGSCLMAADPKGSFRELSKAFELFEKKGDAAGSMLSWSMVVNAIVIVWDDYDVLDQWIERFDRLLARYKAYPSREIESLMVQGICKSLAWRYPARPDLPAWAARLRELVTSSGDSNFRILAGSNLALYHAVSGDIATAQSLVELLNSDLRSPVVGPLKKLVWLATRGALEWNRLDRSGCLATMEEGRAIIEETGVHVLDVRLFAQGITLGLTTGDLPLAQKLFQACAAHPIVTAFDLCHHSLLLADYSLLQGDTAKAIALAETALKHAQDGGNVVMQGLSLPGLILALYQDGQAARAEAVLEEGLACTEGMNFYRSYLHLLAAFFAMEKGDDEAAGRQLREGFAIAARQGYRNFQPWRDAIMTRLCRKALEAGIEVDYVTRLAACRNLDITPPVPQLLTPKEIETLNWVREGKTNWEIAKIQGVSEGTVKFHIANVLRKLEVGSRTRAVAVAMQQGLLAEPE